MCARLYLSVYLQYVLTSSSKAVPTYGRHITIHTTVVYKPELSAHNRLAVTGTLVLAYEIATFWADAVSGHNKCCKGYSKVAAQESLTLSTLHTCSGSLTSHSLSVLPHSLTLYVNQWTLTTI